MARLILYRVPKNLQYFIQKNAVSSLAFLKSDIANFMKRGIKLSIAVVFLISWGAGVTVFAQSEPTLVEIIHSTENELRKKEESSALQNFWNWVNDMERLRRLSRERAEATKRSLKENREKAKDAQEAAERLKRETQERVRDTRVRQKDQLRMYKERMRR